MTPQSFYNYLSTGAEKAVSSAFPELQSLKIAALEQCTFDHICYRAGSEASYNQLKMTLAGIAELIGEQPVNGRPIATYRLKTPIDTTEASVDILELASPKEGADYPEGLEHFELTVEGVLDDFVAKNPHIDWDLGALKSEHHRSVRITLNNGQVVKFNDYLLAAKVAEEMQAQQPANDPDHFAKCMGMIANRSGTS